MLEQYSLPRALRSVPSDSRKSQDLRSEEAKDVHELLVTVGRGSDRRQEKNDISRVQGTYEGS